MDGIILDKENMGAKNEGRRFIAKQFLNSLWGKYGQNLDRNEMATFTDPDKFHKFMADDRYDVKNIYVVNNNCVDVSYGTKAPYIRPAYKTNIAVALATTAYARMRLQEVMQIIGDDLVYCDTDSVIFIDDVNSPHPIVTSSLLGDLKDELEGDYILEFVSTGPKSYSYITAGGQSCTKVKGFTLNLEAKELLNHEVLSKFAMNKGPEKVELPNMKFVINKHKRCITTVSDKTKKFKVVFDKRQTTWEMIDEPGCTVIETTPF